MREIKFRRVVSSNRRSKISLKGAKIDEQASTKRGAS